MLFIRYLLETDMLFIRYLLETDMFNLSFDFYSCLKKRILWERDKLETGKIIFQENFNNKLNKTIESLPHNF